MIIDITGTVLVPGNYGKDCPGNGEVPGVECCCNECDYMICCFGPYDSNKCKNCTNKDCPRVGWEE